MALGSRRQAFLDAASEDQAQDHFAVLLRLAEALKSPDSVRKLISDLVSATKASKDAADVLEAAQRKVDAGLAATKAEIEKLRADHDALVARERLAVDADRRAAAKAAAEAEADRKRAAELVAEQRRRLSRVEQAVAGAA